MLTPQDPLYVPAMRKLVRSLAECPGWNFLVLPLLRKSMRTHQTQILTGTYENDRNLACDRARFQELDTLLNELEKTARSVFSTSTGTVSTSIDDELFPTVDEITNFLRAVSFQPELVQPFQPAEPAEDLSESDDDFQLFQGVPEPKKKP
jgi:hypothetical protein